MSIEYSVGIYKGYEVSREEYEKIEEMFPDFFLTHWNTVHCLDAYNPYDYFFGYELFSHDAFGQVTPLDTIPKEKEEYIKELNELTDLMVKAGFDRREPRLAFVSMVY